MLRYKADLRTLAIVATYFTIAVFSWIYYEQMSWPILLGAMALNGVFCLFLCGNCP